MGEEDDSTSDDGSGDGGPDGGDIGAGDTEAEPSEEENMPYVEEHGQGKKWLNAWRWGWAPDGQRS